jgi:hypothetical protein
MGNDCWSRDNSPLNDERRKKLGADKIDWNAPHSPRSTNTKKSLKNADNSEEIKLIKAELYANNESEPKEPIKSIEEYPTLKTATSKTPRGSMKTHSTLTINEKNQLLQLIDKVKSNRHLLECIDKNVPYAILSADDFHKKHNDDDGHFFLKKMWKIHRNGELELVDQELIAAQRKILGYIVQQFTKNLMSGKSVHHLTLPISIFGKEDSLQRVANSAIYAPICLEKAGEQEDPVERMKMTIAFFVASLHTVVSQEKPFYPAFGETYQGVIGGIPICCEQISHEPPASAFYMKGEKFVFSGVYIFDVSMGANNIEGPQVNRVCVVYPDGTRIYCEWPAICISGTIWGKRTVNYLRKMKFYDGKNNFYSELTMNADDKGFFVGLFTPTNNTELDKIRGKIWKCPPEFIKKLVKREKVKFNPETDTLEAISNVEGNWLSDVNFDGLRYWSMETLRPYVLCDMPNKALPSDASYRLDLLYRKLDDLDNAGKEKDIIEGADVVSANLREGKK